MSYPDEGTVQPVAHDPVRRIREYAAREARLQEVGTRYRVWYDAIQSDNAAIIGAIDAMLELQLIARREKLAPTPAAWLPHLLEAGRIIQARDYLDLVDPTRTESELERYGYELLKTAATEPGKLPEMLAELGNTLWPHRFSWQGILNTLERAVDIRITFSIPSEYYEYLDTRPLQMPLSVETNEPAGVASPATADANGGTRESEGEKPPVRPGIDPRLPADLAEALDVARNAALGAANLVGAARLDVITQEHFTPSYEALRITWRRQTFIHAVLADIVPVSDRNASFGASCAHSAALAMLDRALGFARDACKGDLGQFRSIVQAGALDDLPDARAVVAACEREAYSANAARPDRGSQPPPAADPGQFIERLLAGRDDAELTHLEMEILEKYLKQPSTSKTQADRNKLTRILDRAKYVRFLELHALATSSENHRVPPQTLDEYQRLLTRFGVYTVDCVFVGPPDPTRTPNSEPILNTDCIPIPGTKPLVCPRSAPKLPVELLPQVEARFRSLRLVDSDKTVLWVGRQARMETLCMYRNGCACFAENAPPPTNGTRESEGERLPADQYAELRRFARADLKGQERAVIEALCDAGGELPINDLAVKDGVDWDEPKKGFKNAQDRLNEKLKRLKWRLIRQDNAAKLISTESVKEARKNAL